MDKTVTDKPDKPKCIVCGKTSHTEKFNLSGTNERGKITANLEAALEVSITNHTFYRKIDKSIIKQYKKIAKRVGEKIGAKAGKTANMFHVLYRKIPDAIEGHHLITCESVSGEIWYNLFYMFGYDVNCPQNGVLLPGDMLVACHFKVPLHMSHHGAEFNLKKMDATYVSYIAAVMEKVQSVMNAFENGSFCEELDEGKIKDFHEDLLIKSESIFKKIKRFQWLITADGRDYAPGSPIGCFNHCRTITTKRESMESKYSGTLGVTATGDIATKLAEAGGSLCRRDHTLDGCIGLVNWYKDSRYNKLDKIF